ncbi:hypothetical protein SDC9_191585 [bioreactor metagenome]|uniref:Uncharacterized protein n=1 Tax=bioreactor metagenome TaxID=1076179 RepID=A0A645I6K0_9ZZZZ
MDRSAARHDFYAPAGGDGDCFVPGKIETRSLALEHRAASAHAFPLHIIKGHVALAAQDDKGHLLVPGGEGNALGFLQLNDTEFKEL